MINHHIRLKRRQKNRKKGNTGQLGDVVVDVVDPSLDILLNLLDIVEWSHSNVTLQQKINHRSATTRIKR